MKEILIGEIMGAHGIRGQVKVAVFSQHPEKRFAPGKKMWAGDRYLEVEQIQYHNHVLLVKFKEVADRNMAEALFRAELRVNLSDLEPLPAGQYYDFQLLGLDVYCQGLYQGVLKEMLETGANDVYVVSREGKKDLLIPAIPEIPRQVDLEAKKIDFQLPDGLLECYE